jgi:hypothetical protein
LIVGNGGGGAETSGWRRISSGSRPTWPTSTETSSNLSPTSPSLPPRYAQHEHSLAHSHPLFLPSASDGRPSRRPLPSIPVLCEQADASSSGHSPAERCDRVSRPSSHVPLLHLKRSLPALDHATVPQGTGLAHRCVCVCRVRAGVHFQAMIVGCGPAHAI